MSRSAHVVLIVLAAAACGGDSNGPDDGPLTLDSGARVTRIVSAAGATLTSVAGDGTRYTLVIPAEAIADSAEIAMSPILAATGTLGDAGLVAGVRLEPDGLVFTRPATLTIERPAGAAAGFAVVADGTGAAPHLVLSTVTGGVRTMTVSHFSVAAVVAQAELIPAPPAGAVSSTAQAVIAGQLGFLTTPATDAVQTIVSAFHTWFASSVKVKLQAAAGGGATDVALVEASSDYSTWLLAVGIASSVLADAGGQLEQLSQALSAEITESRQLAAAAFQAGITRNDNACLAQPTNLVNAFAATNNALYWQEVATSYLLPSDYPALQLDAVVNALCLSIAFNAAAFPEQITVGQTYPLNVRAGYAIGGAAPILTFSPLQAPRVEAQPAGAVAASATAPLAGLTDGGGTFATQLTVQQPAVVINVHACALGLTIPSRLSLHVCRDTLVVRNGPGSIGGIVVSPAYLHLTAVVQPGVGGVACDTSRYVYVTEASDSHSCSGAASTGTAHAATNYEYTQTQTGQVSQLHFTSHGASDASSSDAETTAIGAAYVSFHGSFEITAPSGTFVTSGSLTNVELNYGAGALVMLTTRSGSSLVGLFCKGTATLSSFCPAGSADEGFGDKTWANLSVPLVPGQYYIDIWSLARVQVHGNVSGTPSSSAAADVTITVSQQ